MRAAAILALLLALSSSCRVPAHAPDARAERKSIARELVNAPVVHVELVRVNGAAIPEVAWSHALATLGRHVRGEIVVHEREPLTLGVGGKNTLFEAFEWPLDVDAAQLVERELVAGAWYELSHDGEPIATVSVGPDGTRHATPIAPRDTLLVAVLPRDPSMGSLHGWCRPTSRIEHESGRFVSGGSLIVLQSDVILAHAWWPVSAEKLFEHTLVHELGHALGLPADPARTWIGPHSGAHCTHPECALYPAFDWRAVLSGILHGWPLDFCEACKAEIAAARDATGVGTGAAPVERR